MRRITAAVLFSMILLTMPACGSPSAMIIKDLDEKQYKDIFDSTIK